MADRDFAKVWAGQSVALVGEQVTVVALPLTAALWLGAGPAQMGLLVAAGSVPYLLVGLAAGVWVDRVRRRRVLVAATVTRAALLVAVPVLAVTGALTMPSLVAVAVGAATCTMLLELAYPAYTPVVVPAGRLDRANSRLTLSRSVAELAGPGAAGVLVGVVTAPGALLVEAGALVLSALGLAAVRRPEAVAPRGPDRAGALAEARQGLRVTFGDPVLRAGACAAATYNLFWSAAEAVLVLHLVRGLGMSATTFGLCFSVGAVGAVIGSLLTVPLARRLGTGPATVVSAAVACTSLLLLVAVADAGRGAVLFAGALFLRGLGLTGWNVQIRVLQQRLVPNELLGRMNAAYLLLSLGAGSVGALLAGGLAQQVGTRPVLVGAVLGVSTAWVWLWASPLRTRRPLPAAATPGRRPGSAAARATVDR